MINKVVDKHFIYLVIIISTILYYRLDALGDDHADDEDRFDGSKYAASSFKDTSFEKQDYKELRSTGASSFPRDRAGLDLKEGGLLSRKRQSDKEIVPAGAGAEKGPLKSGGEHKIGADPEGPVTDLPSDWVPDGIKLTNNGGFTIAPDNGSPVPYRLNGHIEIERGRP